MARFFSILSTSVSIILTTTFPNPLYAAPTAIQQNLATRNTNDAVLEARDVIRGIKSKKAILGDYDETWIEGVFGKSYSVPTLAGLQRLPIHTRIGDDIPVPSESNIKMAYTTDGGDGITGMAKGYIKNEAIDLWTAYSEAEALKQIQTGQYADFGTMSTWPVNNHILPVILMKPVQGEDILQSNCYKKAKEDEKQRLRKSFKDELRKTVLLLAKNQQILHVNWTSNNVRVHTAAKWGIGKCKIESVTIVNWSYPNVFHVKPNQNMPNFDQWFDKRFKLSRPDIQA